MEPFPPRTPLTLSYAGQIARQRHFTKLPSILYLRFAIVNAWKERPVVEGTQRRWPCEMVAKSALPLRPAPAAPWPSNPSAEPEPDRADGLVVESSHARTTRGYRTSGRGRGRGSGRAPKASCSSSNHTTHHRNAEHKHGRDSGWSGGEHNPRVIVLDEDEEGMGVLPEECWGTEFSSDGRYGGMVEGEEKTCGKGEGEEGWITVVSRRKKRERERERERRVMGDGVLGSGS